MSASKGTLLKIPATPFNIKAHKAFVKGITGAVGSAKVSLVFDDEWMNGNIHDGTGNTAGISDVESNTKSKMVCTITYRDNVFLTLNMVSLFRMVKGCLALRQPSPSRI